MHTFVHGNQGPRASVSPSTKPSWLPGQAQKQRLLKLPQPGCSEGDFLQPRAPLF